jgi:hypothetical protein
MIPLNESQCFLADDPAWPMDGGSVQEASRARPDISDMKRLRRQIAI